MVIDGVPDGRELAALCARLQRVLRGGGADEVSCDVAGVTRPDLRLVDALARLDLTASRLGCRLRLRRASPQLCELIGLVGLGRLIRGPARLSVQAQRQAEGGEVAGGVQEEGDAADPVA
ncbi:MAG: STAS domain-containing protein [Candidatus Limnocylindria bacterium]